MATNKKICPSCGIEKDLLSCFRVRKNKNNTDAIYYRSECMECEKKYNKNRKILNKDKIKQQRKEYYTNNKEKEINNNKNYYENNKTSINKKRTAYFFDRYNNDSNFRIRHLISVSVRDSLKLRFSDKNNLSILQFLPYTIEELKIHLEKQFELWMTWENHGNFDVKTWDDNDKSTWTWQIDHIVPHSTFEYLSMEDQQFKDCWALSNLRPLSSKQNIMDGNRRHHDISNK